MSAYVIRPRIAVALAVEVNSPSKFSSTALNPISCKIMKPLPIGYRGSNNRVFAVNNVTPIAVDHHLCE